jgi:hypothetical protein
MRNFTCLILLCLSFNIHAQIGGLKWTNSDLDNIETFFQGYSNFRMVSPYMVSGMRAINEYITSLEMVSFIGSTPVHKYTIILYNDSDHDYRRVRYGYDQLYKETSGKKEIFQFSKKSVRSADERLIAGFQTEIGTHLVEIGLVYSDKKYYLQEIVYNQGRKYFDFDENSNIPQWKDSKLSLRAKAYWETMGVQDLNPFNLKEYSEAFGSDLLVFHNASVPLKAFGFLGDGYLKFGDLPEGVLGLANGMDDNCIEKITISSKEWNRSNDWKRLWVVYHEIAHDVFGVKHGEGGELMNATIPIDVNFADFYLAKIKLLDHVKDLDLNELNCN